MELIATAFLAVVAIWLITEKLRWELRWKRLGRLSAFNHQQGENLSQHHKDEWVLEWWGQHREPVCEGRR